MNQAFTLVEMLVVVTIVGLLTAIVLPSMVELFTSGADASAYNVLAGQLSAARSLAIQERTLAGLHAQLADPNGQYTRKMAEACFTAVVWDDPATTPSTDFTLAEGYSPQALPGTIALGRVDAPFYSTGTGQYDNTYLTGLDRFRFTSLTFVFSPGGQLAAGAAIQFDNTSALFADPATSRAYLWDPDVANHTTCETSVNAAVMFDWAKFLAATDRDAYLRQQGQLIAVNLYTGSPLGR